MTLNGPSPVGSDNNVVVQAVNVDHEDILTSFVLENLDPLRQSSEMGVDIYTEALERVLLKIVELT